MKRLIVDIVSGKASVGTIDFLGERWNAFQAVCASSGMRWNRVRGLDSRNEGPVESLPALVRDLGAEGFDLEVTEPAKAVLRAAATSGLSTVEEAAQAQIAAREVTLGERGLSLWKPFQKDGAIFLAARDRGLNADEVGTGKTIQALVALPENAAVLVACPASVVINWAREAKKWRPDLHPCVVLKGVTLAAKEALADDGIGSISKAEWPEESEIVIVGWESLPCETDVVSEDDATVVEIARTMDGDPAPGTVLIGDEIHRAKNPKAKLTRKWGTLRDAVKSVGGKVWGLSGTPIYNRPFDLLNVLRGIGCFQDVFVSFSDFMRRMGGYQGRYGVEWSGIVDPTVARSMRRVMIRREKKDVMPFLPRMTIRDIEVDPSGALVKVADEIAAKMDSDDMHLLSDLHGKIAFEDLSRLHAEMSRVGYEAALDMIEDYEADGEPIVVFCPHREQVIALGEREGWGTILGGDDLVARQGIIDLFQEGGLRGLAVTIKAGGTGITLTRASHSIFLSLDWSPSENEQAAGRLHRGGQEKAVLITRIVPNHPFVRRLMKLLGWKTTMNQDAIGAASIIDSLAEERKRVAQEALVAAERESMATAHNITGKVDVREVLARIPAGRYALDSAETCSLGTPTHTVFWHLDKPTDGRWAGFAFLKVQRGPETGRFSTIRPDGLATSAAASVLERLAEDPLEASRRYGREIGECGVCGRALTDEHSRSEGIGPVCLQRLQAGGVS